MSDVYIFSNRSDPQNNIARALDQMVKNVIETGDTHRYFALETLDGLLRVEIFSSDTERLINVIFP